MPDVPQWCIPAPLEPDSFNSSAIIPCGLTILHIKKAMTEFTEFLGFVDAQLYLKEMTRFEEMLMPANFSSMVGEFMSATIPKYCKSLVKNTYHNGHPDLLPANMYPRDAAQHAGANGIELKASRYLKAWQGHNAEDAWLMVFVFESGRPTDKMKGIGPVKFRFLMVAGAMLKKPDWQFAGRSETSRRTITAIVKPEGAAKMTANWSYKCRALREGHSELISPRTDK